MFFCSLFVFFSYRCGRRRRQEEAAAAGALKFLCRWTKLKVKCSSWSSCASCAPFLKVAAAGWESGEGKLSSAACNYKRSSLFAQRLCVNVTDGREFSLNCFRLKQTSGGKSLMTRGGGGGGGPGPSLEEKKWYQRENLYSISWLLCATGTWMHHNCI